MVSRSPIEWTEQTWNPIVGCSIVSPGCTNCYAMTMAARIDKMTLQSHYAGLTKKVNGKQAWTGKLALAGDYAFHAPLRRRKPTTYFVNSMGDLFHEDCPDEWIDKVFAVMALTPHHTYQVLTKRAKRMRDYFTARSEAKRNSLIAEAAAAIANHDKRASELHYLAGHNWSLAEWPIPNVWLGVSTERQKEADDRIPELLATPAAVRFVSAEPLLGPVDLSILHGPDSAPVGHPLVDIGALRLIEGLDWVIVGGESGRGARPMSIQWARELRDQCARAGVSFFFKQWGEWRPAGSHRAGDPGRFAFGDYEYDRTAMVQVDGYPRQFTMFGARSTMQRVGKKAAGRLLDGVEHNGFPKVPA
ncbi:phage Gp37/Gp68 family protein [Bradyrhizobium sp. INPA03-11B]|uniref:phage Gp37/Gp68 family protein n=1 Tax=Bradyrhizobium sp. INPA03-11B TaxID=418598 RepID=UPI00338FE17E